MMLSSGNLVGFSIAYFQELGVSLSAILTRDISKQRSPESLESAKTVRMPCFHFGLDEIEFEFYDV